MARDKNIFKKVTDTHNERLLKTKNNDLKRCIFSFFLHIHEKTKPDHQTRHTNTYFIRKYTSFDWKNNNTRCQYFCVHRTQSFIVIASLVHIQFIHSGMSIFIMFMLHLSSFFLLFLFSFRLHFMSKDR